MENKILISLLIISLFFSSSEVDSVTLEINKANTFINHDNSLTPLVVTLLAEDKGVKINDVDLICIVDVSGSMSGDRINMVKESLKYLVSIMAPEDRLGIVIFNYTASILFELTSMSEGNKNLISEKIDELQANGGTNIFSGLQKGLDLITNDYLSGKTVCSMILLSDGYDAIPNADLNFEEYIKNQAKTNYAFTLHSLGYSEAHDPVLMNKISLIRDGAYFFIRYLSMVKDAILEIYGSLSTNFEVNVVINTISTYKINKVYGSEDMYQSKITSTPPYGFSTTIIHFVYGKKYDFILLVEIPDNVPKNQIIVTSVASPFEVKANYVWDSLNDACAYEVYMRAISYALFKECYNNENNTNSINKIKSEMQLLNLSYDGIRDWQSEYQEVIEDFENFETYGEANLLSKIRELIISKLGMHYNNENLYQRKIIDEAYEIDTENWEYKEIIKESNIKTEINDNYFYFYVKEGSGKINDIYFSGKGSSVLFYSDNAVIFNIKPKTQNIKLYYKKEKVTRVQNIIDFSSGGKFNFEKDFPFDFYTQIDGSKDITFNIQIIKLNYNKNNQNSEHNFDIKAYVLNSQEIENIASGNTEILDSNFYRGYYDKGHRLGKIIINKEKMVKDLSLNYKNYLYIVISKSENLNKNIYYKVEGQFSFVSMDYIFSIIPESFYIYSNLSKDQKYPHLYTLQMEPKLSQKLRIEFSNYGNELDCKILKYKNYALCSDDIFEDFEDFEIKRYTHMGKTYIDINQASLDKNKFDLIILSIFLKSDKTFKDIDNDKLSYIIRYTTFSDYGIYSFNDLKETNGLININTKEIYDLNYYNKINITISFNKLKYKKNDEDYITEDTRFYLKLYSNLPKNKNIYQSLSLFESISPSLYKEDENNFNEFNFLVDINITHYLIIYTVSNIVNEILSYESTLIKGMSCYNTCKKCKDLGHFINHKCLICNDEYPFQILNQDNITRNCYKKCEHYYYSDFEKNFFCLYNNECPEEYPKLIKEKGECVKECKFDPEYKYDFINTCYSECPPRTKESLNKRFYCEEICDKERPYKLNSTQECREFCDISEITKGSCFLNFSENEVIDKVLNDLEQSFINGNVDLHKLKDGQEEIIKFETTIVTFVSYPSHLLKNNATRINIGNCENKLRQEYTISNETELFIRKIESIEEGKTIPKIEYDIYYQNNDKNLLKFEKLNTSVLCDTFDFYFPINLSENIDKLNLNSKYYNDMCTPGTSEFKTDMTLEDRKKEYYNNIKKNNIFQDGCFLSEYDHANLIAKFSCENENKNTQLININIKKGFMNLGILKCKSCNVFNFITNIKSNIGLIIMVCIIFIFIIILIIFGFKGFNSLKNKIDETINKKFKGKANNTKNKINSKIFDNNNTNNNNKIKNNIKRHKTNSSKRKHKNRNIIIRGNSKNLSHINLKSNNSLKNNTFILGTSADNNKVKTKTLKQSVKPDSDYEFNWLTYEQALKHDKRRFLDYYCSLIKRKQLFIFSFFPLNDNNSMVIKIFVFFLAFSLHYAANALFFTNSNIHKIYDDKGKFNFTYQLNYIIFSCLISTFILKLIVHFLVLTDKDIIEIKNKLNKAAAINMKQQQLKKIIAKFVIFFIIVLALLLFIAYYISCFHIIYINSNIYLLENSFISLGFSCFYPFIICLFPVIFRACSLKRKNMNCLYKFSQILQII